LASAAQSLNQGNLNQTKNQIDAAEGLIAELTAYFDSLAVTLKTERVTLYINTSEQRLTTLRQEFNAVSSQLSASAQAAASTAINQAQESLTKAKQYLTNQQLNQTIAALTNVNANEKTIADYIYAVSPTPTPSPTPKPNLSTRNNATNVSSSPNVAANLK
jgi:stage V sporulation protein SpoVS